MIAGLSGFWWRIIRCALMAGGVVLVANGVVDESTWLIVAGCSCIGAATP